MFKTERQEKILKILNQRKHCTIKYLANELYVSPVTIRRDLEALKNQGFLRKYYGGASIMADKNEVPLSLRETSNTSEKYFIAQKAYKLINNGDTIFLDASSTAQHIIDFINSDQNITVVTNSYKAISALAERHIKTYCAGGLLYEKSMAFIGPSTEAFIKSMHADIMFFSSQGITLEGNITDYSELETRLRQVMMQQAKRKVFLCDSSKVGKTFLFHVCNVTEIDEVISDRKLDFTID